MNTNSSQGSTLYIPASSRKTSNGVLFDYCVQQQQLQQQQYGGGATQEDNANATLFLIQCVAGALSRDHGAYEFARVVGVIITSALVFFMQAGFAMVCAGAVRKKNVQNSMLKNLLDACGSAMAFFLVGYAFAYGGMDKKSSIHTFVGYENFFLMNVDDLSFWLFQYVFCATSATIVAGTLAERCQMTAYVCYSMMLSGWVYPIVVHAVWNTNGILSAYSVDPLWGVGMIDFSGSGVVHVTGGITALYATIILGPRRGRFHDESGRKLDTPIEIKGHSMSLQMLGTFILWFGWYGFNSGSALTSLHYGASEEISALAAVNTTLSAGAAGLSALFMNLWYLERYTGEAFFDLKFAMNGALAGLVAITAGCAVLEPWAAVVVGFFAGILYIIGSRGLELLRLDDAVDAIPVHLVNGFWGLLAVGLFCSPQRQLNLIGDAKYPGLFYTIRAGNFSTRLLGTQLVGFLFIIGWVSVVMIPFFVWLDWQGWFRSDPLEELVGLDTSYHGGLALLGQEEGVDPEYVSAFVKRKQDQNSLKRRHVSTTTTTGMDNDEGEDV